jgi:glycosyltransferase involved in cell wall biosynthesis
MKISVITPNYNYEKYIGKTIESIVNQNYNEFEHIIIDDGSTDDSIKIIESYVKQFPSKIILIRQENKGQTSAINVGMKRATGDIICWINSDDTFCENIFKDIITCFEINKNCDILFGDMNVIDLEGNFIYRRRHLRFSYLTGCLLGFTTILSSNCVFWKKEAMLKNGYFNESLKCNMDGDFYSRLTKDMSVKKINKSLANFRKQNHTKASEKSNDWDEIVKKETKFEKENSFNNLAIAKIIPFKYSLIIKLPFQFTRTLKRALFLHYYKKHIEIKNYENS